MDKACLFFVYILIYNSQKWKSKMNFTKILVASAFIGTSFAAEVQTTDTAQVEAFKGNWTETFQTTTPLGAITHTPTSVKFGFMQSGKKLSLGGNVNGYSFSSTLVVLTDSTREEFVAALMAANIYNGK